MVGKRKLIAVFDQFTAVIIIKIIVIWKGSLSSSSLGLSQILGIGFVPIVPIFFLNACQIINGTEVDFPKKLLISHEREKKRHKCEVKHSLMHICQI